MADKFIPNGDSDFSNRATAFAKRIAEAPQRYAVSDEDSTGLTVAAERFASSYLASRAGVRSASAIAAKERDRVEAEKIVRRLANAIRANERIDPVDKIALRLRPRVQRPKVLTVPNEAPRLTFVRAIHEASAATPEHELRFSARDHTPKPEGAVRLELFVDLIPQDEEVPTHPAHTRTGRPMYLRSYTRSPIRLVPPLANVPMQVVYWARWADSAGNVGPFGETVIGWIEGGRQVAQLAKLPHARHAVMEVTLGEESRVPETVVVALLAAGRMGAGQASTGTSGRALPDPTRRAMRQLEGPTDAAASEAA